MSLNPTYDSAQREWRSDEGRSNRWRDENEGRYGSAQADRDVQEDYRFLRFKLIEVWNDRSSP